MWKIPDSALTVLIFSYERPRELAAALKYWGHAGCQIIVADGSAQPIQYPLSANIEYLHRPGVGALDRIVEMSTKVKTRYVTLSPDDDFTGFEALGLVTSFLDDHPDYSSAQGLYVRFSKRKAPAYLHWFWDYRYAAKYSHTDESVEQRIFSAMAYPVMHYCYSVMRSECLRRSMQILAGVSEASMSSSTYELGFIFALMSQGKHVTLPIFYAAREAHDRRWKHISFPEWVSENSVTGYSRWQSNVRELLQEVCGMSASHSAEVVDRAVEILLEGYRKKKNLIPVTGKKTLRQSLKEMVKRNLSVEAINLGHFLLFQFRRWVDLFGMFGVKVSAYASYMHDWRNIRSALYGDHEDGRS